MRWLALPLVLFAVFAQAQTSDPESPGYAVEIWGRDKQSNRINPYELRVSEAAKSPESLWAFILDPSTRFDDRMAAAEQAKDVLPARYVPRLASTRRMLEDAGRAHNWWVQREPGNALDNGFRPELPESVRKQTVLGVPWEPPAAPLDYPWELADMRRMPWPWQVQRALETIEIPLGSVPGIELVRDLPCATQDDEQVVLETLRGFPMTVETYGVLRNLIQPRSDLYIWPSLPRWLRYRPADDWFAAQAFLVEAIALDDGRPRITFVTELISSASEILYDLQHLLADLHGGHASRSRASRGQFPYTAYLALAKRIEEGIPRDEDSCGLASDASRLAALLDDPTFPHERTTLAGCRAWLAAWQDWWATHRGPLEAGAVAESAAIAEARERMKRVTVCRP